MTAHATISTRQDSAEGPEGAEGPFLVLCSETVEHRITQCPRRGSTLLVNHNDPTQVIQAGCDAYICDWCGPRKARKFAQAVAWQLRQHERSRFVTLTLAHDDWQKRRGQMKELARKVRKAGYRVEWAWTTEVGSKTGMVHIHATQWGDFIPWKVLAELWGKRVRIEEIKAEAEKVTGYMAKGADKVTQYMAKGSNAEYQHWLELNGGRPIHTTRGFFEGRGIRGAWAALQAERQVENPPLWGVLDPHLGRIYFDLKHSKRENWREEWAVTFTRWISLHAESSSRADNLGDIGGVNLEVHFVGTT